MYIGIAMTTILIVTFIGGAALAALVATICHLSAKLSSLEQRIQALEESQPKRHTLRTLAGIEDAQAVAIDMYFTANELTARLENLRDILGLLRSNGPHGYDPNRKNQKDKRREA